MPDARLERTRASYPTCPICAHPVVSQSSRCDHCDRVVDELHQFDNDGSEAEFRRRPRGAWFDDFEDIDSDTYDRAPLAAVEGTLESFRRDELDSDTCHDVKR